MMSQSRRQAGGGGAHEQVRRSVHGVGLPGRHLQCSPLRPWDAVKLGASFPELCCTPGRLRLVTLAAAPAAGLAHGPAPMSSHLEPTHPAGVGWRMGSWAGSKGKAEKKHSSLSNWKINKSGHERKENIEKEAHLRKAQEGGLGGKEKRIPLGAEDSCLSGQGVDDTGPQCGAGCARRTSVTHSRM